MNKEIIRTSSRHESEWRTVRNHEKNCFGCGSNNDHGLQMKFETDGKKLRSVVTATESFRGWSNLVHGGVLSTILDEVMGWTAIIFTGRFILTRKMNIEFKKPVRVNSVLIATGMIKERKNERTAIVAAEIRDQDNNICVAAEGDFALFTPRQFRRLQVISDSDFDEILKVHPGMDAGT